jgi:restriction system protein
MIENNPTNVQAAFEMLLEEIEAEIDFINGVGSKAFEKRDYDRAREALEHAGKLTGFRDKTVGLKKEWDGFAVIEVDEEDRKKAQAQRQNLGRLQRGMRTREEAYYVPILQVLAEMGGSGKVADVLDRVGKKMKGALKKSDYESLASGTDSLRWRNTAQWARNSMVNEGLLKKDSPRGVWEIGDKGKGHLKQNG